MAKDKELEDEEIRVEFEIHSKELKELWIRNRGILTEDEFFRFGPARLTAITSDRKHNINP